MKIKQFNNLWNRQEKYLANHFQDHLESLDRKCVNQTVILYYTPLPLYFQMEYIPVMQS